MDDIYEPLSAYRDDFSERHAQNVATYFDALVKQSAIDPEANAKTVKKLNQAMAQAKKVARVIRFLKALRLLLWMLVIGCLIAATMWCVPVFNKQPAPYAIGWFVGVIVVTVAAIFVIFRWLSPAIRKRLERAADLAKQCDNLREEAWSQVRPLLQSFDWDMPANLVHQTVPRIELDPYLTQGRYDDLCAKFGLVKAPFGDDVTILQTLSGEINGNPFIVLKLREMEMHDKVYTGTRTVSYQECDTDEDGHTTSHTVVETLTASIVRPAPCYREFSALIYGNEAAPKLCFSRHPSQFSGQEDTMINRWRMRRETKKLEAFSRNLDDESQYTILGNRTFETLFHAVDRNDEIGFRLLFTPLAQTQMVDLLKDKKVGFGDDFHFIKQECINVILPQHLSSADLSGDPTNYYSYDFTRIKATFTQYNRAYFKDLYFSLAPLLTIPLFHQYRTHETIYKDVLAHHPSCWEYEGFANALPPETFVPEAASTPSLLRTTINSLQEKVAQVQILARAFHGAGRTEHVSELAGDGCYYDVPVDWTEYLPVQKISMQKVAAHPDLTLPEFNKSKRTYQTELNTKCAVFYRHKLFCARKD